MSSRKLLAYTRAWHRLVHQKESGHALHNGRLLCAEMSDEARDEMNAMRGEILDNYHMICTRFDVQIED